MKRRHARKHSQGARWVGPCFSGVFWNREQHISKRFWVAGFGRLLAHCNFGRCWISCEDHIRRRQILLAVSSFGLNLMHHNMTNSFRRGPPPPPTPRRVQPSPPRTNEDDLQVPVKKQQGRLSTTTTRQDIEETFFRRRRRLLKKHFHVVEFNCRKRFAAAQKILSASSSASAEDASRETIASMEMRERILIFQYAERSGFRMRTRRRRRRLHLRDGGTRTRRDTKNAAAS